MSAVISGNGLGLFDASSAGGAPGGGQAGQARQYVNIANGNLVLQSQDEQLLFRGLSIAHLRTYNSQGTLGQVGADGWLTGFERRVELLSGTFNTAGSVMRRYVGDGSYQDFSWSAPGTYRSAAGDDAHDILAWTSGSRAWTYVEGTTRNEERYADHADAVLRGRLTRIGALKSDSARPSGWLVLYDGNERISEIRADDGTSAGDALIFGYDAAGRLESISTRENGSVCGQVKYGYDMQGRLASVLVDLTPQDQVGDLDEWDEAATPNNDGYLYRTTYTYTDATSLRISSVRYGDGSVFSYTYDGLGRISTVTSGDTNANDADGSGETLSFSFSGNTTRVTDSLGRTWVYAYNADRRLESVTSPAVSGLSDVASYSYDSSGNLMQVRTVRGAQTLSLLDWQYDANGNVLWQWDALGNALQRTYSASNQVLSETRYANVDPDRTGGAAPQNGLVVRYVYDNRDRLRFAIDATGAVTEYEYAISGNGIGQQAVVRHYLGESYSGDASEAALIAWASAGRRVNSTLTELGYDLWGRLSQTIAYAAVDSAGNGVLDSAGAVTLFHYDAQGLLRQQITLRGADRSLVGMPGAGSEVVDYVYDGMGRLLAVNSRSSEDSTNDDAKSISTTYTYLDSGHQLAVTSDNGRVRTETRDASGRLVSVSEAGMVNGGSVVRTSQHHYDSTGQLRATEDTSGTRTYFFYDAKGRLEAMVDGTGAVTRTAYDGADRVLQTIRYANRVTTSGWLVAGAVSKAAFADIGVIPDPANDRAEVSEYDGAGRLSTQVDAVGSITAYTYDAAGRLVQVKITDAAQTAATARTTRFFHDDAGREIGRLDPEGYLVETVYDLAGRPIKVTRYATAAPTAQWATGALAQLRPGAAAADQVTRTYYDGRGNRIGELDAAGYVTEWVFDEAGHARAERRYAWAVTWQASDTFMTLRARAGSTYRENRMAYNGRGQLVAQTNPEGTVTRFGYDEAGRLVRTESAFGTTEVREGYRRFNVFDELIGEIDGEGALKARTLLGGRTLDDPTLTQAELDQSYAMFGTRHEYDALGRRIESIDAAGGKTWTFYDAAGRPAFLVRGVADALGVSNAQGEVVETRYNAFGQASETFTYSGRITLASAGSRASAGTAIAALTYASSSDTRRQFTYTTRGLLNSITDATGAQTRYAYNAFGELIQEQFGFGSTAVSVNDLFRDRRGLLSARVEGRSSSVERTLTWIRDAFGRVITHTQGQTNGHAVVTSYGYDGLGRQLTVQRSVLGRSETEVTTYDAYARVVMVAGADNRLTTYTYDTAARAMVINTPQGTEIRTIFNRHGQAVTVSERLTTGRNFTQTYTYDASGRQLTSVNDLGHGERSEYDARGLLTASIDATGRRVELQYDAAGRVLRRVEDPEGLALTTSYVFDGQGRSVSVTDPSGRATSFAYDGEGRLLEAVIDPAGLKLRTAYAYDAQGRTVSVTDAGGTTTDYVYDALGRRTGETVDPDGLALATQYFYDQNDNLVRRIDAGGATTRYTYDEAGRLIHTVDARGGVTRQWYDAAGRVVARRTFAGAIASPTLTDATTIAALDALLVSSASDEGEYRVYDEAGRQRWTIGIDGSVVESVYAAGSQLLGTRSYATRVTLSVTTLNKMLAGTARPSDIVPSQNTLDEQTWYVLDSAGRAQYTVNATGGVVETYYDATGRVVGSRAFAAAITLDGTLRNQLRSGAATIETLASRVAAIIDDARDIRGYTVRDAAGRERYIIDASGAVSETKLDAAGHAVGERRYAASIAMDDGLLARLKSGAATVADIAGRLSADSARDPREYFILDAAGRTVLRIDGAGYVRRMGYDSVGRVIWETRHAIPAAIAPTLRARLEAGTATEIEVLSATTTNGAADRSIRYVRDAAGRVRYTLTLDSGNLMAVVESRYDAMGRVVAEVAYGVRIGTATVTTESAVASALAAAGSDLPANHRLTQFVFDNSGRLRYTIDSLGYVHERVYDGIGRLLEERAFDAKWTGQASEAVLALAFQVPSRRTQHRYDASGHRVESTDALGYSEDFSYDALGRLISYTDKLDKTWTYGYDAAGRRTRETSPLVEVTDPDTGVIVSSAVVTNFQYDALGNLVTRIDNATGGSGQVRTTRYTYNNRGNQVRTEYVGLATVEVTYDALGQAVVQKDVLGIYSYRTYDVLGRLAYEVDQEGYVTSYGYNAYGEQTNITRHAQRLNTAALLGWSAGQPLAFSLLTAPGVVQEAGARRLQSAYDQLGRKISVTQPSVSYVRADGSTSQGSPVTRFAYDAYGQLAKESVLLQGAPDQADAVWADTFRYYDAMGRVLLQVDAEGYATAHTYDAHGKVLETVEYARALDGSLRGATTRPGAPAAGDAVSGYDRTTRWTYDALGRRVTETAVRHYQRVDGSSGVKDVTLRFDYDAEDRLVSASGEQGTTVTRYDALGRVLSVAEPRRTVLKSDAEFRLLNSIHESLSSELYEQISPYTEMGYDAFGNLVRTRRFANGLRAGQTVGTRDDNRDQVDVTRYDVYGRAVLTRTAGGKEVTSQYDAAGHVTSSSYYLNGSSDERDAWIDSSYTYDKLGRQLTSHQKRRGAERSEIDESVAYNAFGEITAKSYGAVSGNMMSGALAYVYDDSGRLVSSNETGQVRLFGYNLAGHQQREVHSAYLNAAASVEAITYTVTDRLGRTVGTRMPAYSDMPALTAQSSQRLDRWGNVLQINDARGYQTNYRYNDFNQLIRDERPLVLVVGEDASRVWSRPVNEWYYDAFGRLIATRDANGNVRTNDYDAAGNLLRYTDALGHSTRYAYDVLGNQRLVENARGYITYKEYDLQGRVIRIGDYLPDASGQWRGKSTLAQYVLNENGDRTRVIDALTFAQLYDYDGNSRLLRSVTAMGVTLNYAHDLLGKKASETNALNDRLSWEYDVFGRVTDHRNLSGRDFDYIYSGDLLTSESAAGGVGAAASKSYKYYANGMISEIGDGGLIHRYKYDASGNRIEESTTGTDANGLTVNIVTRTVYDAHNRVQRVTQDDAGKRIFDVLYEYDAVGNRRHVLANSGYGPNAPAVPNGSTAPVVIRSVADRTVRKGIVSEFRILFSDVFRDAEQDRLNLSVSVNDGAPPPWLQYRIDADTGEIVFTANPSAGSADQDVKIRLIATESETAEHYSATTEFTVRVRQNSAPELLASGAATLPRAKIGKSWNQSLAAAEWFRDVDVGDRLRLTVVNPGDMPSWLQIDASNPDALHLSGTPGVEGTYQLQVRAIDEAGASVIKTFIVDAGLNRAPTGTAPASREAILGRAFEWTQPAASVFTDADGDALRITATGLPGWMSFQFLDDRAQPQLRLSGQVPSGVPDGTVYSITMTAADPDGETRSVTMQVTARQNRGPVASDWTAPPMRVHDAYDVTVPLTTLFSDPEGDPLTITTVGAPNFVTMSLDPATRTLRLTAAPMLDAQAGDYTFQVTARDGDGLSSTATVHVHVGGDRPPMRDTSVALADQSARVGRPFAFALPSNLYYDPDGDAITLVASLLTQTVSEYFDDSQPPGQWVTVVDTSEDPLPSWIQFDSFTRTFFGTVPPDQPLGNIKLRVSAFDGRMNSWGFDPNAGAGVFYDDIVVLTIVPFVNHAPLYNGGLSDHAIRHGDVVNFPLPAGAFSEPDGDGLWYSAQVQGPGHSESRNVSTDPNEPEWRDFWVDGTWVDIGTIGLQIDPLTGRIAGTATNLTQQSVRTRITAHDPHGGTVSGEFSFQVANTAPTVSSIPTQSLGRRQGWSFPAGAYFSDPNEDVLTYSAGGLPAGLSLNAASGVISGSSAAAPGNYTVTITASDGRGGTASASFTLALINQPPSAPTILNQSAAAGSAWSFVVPAFTDPNADPLSYSVSGQPSWMSFDAGTRRLSGTPGPVGSWSITVTARDSYDAVTTQTFVVTTPNTWPSVVNTIPPQSAGRNVLWSYQVPIGTFADINGDSLSYTASNIPSGLNFDPATRTLSGRVMSQGVHSITITAHDGRGGSASTTLTLNVVNNAPTLQQPLPDRTMLQNQTVSWALPPGTFADANGDALSYTLMVEWPGYYEYRWDPNEQANMPFWVEPHWEAGSTASMSIDANGTISGKQNLFYDPVYGFAGLYRYKVTAHDGYGGTAESIFNVNLNLLPVAPNVSTPPTARQAIAYWHQLPAFSDASPLTYSLSGLPAGMWFDANSRVITGTPQVGGQFTLYYTANDGQGGVTTVAVAFYVEVNQAPVAGWIPNQSGMVGNAFSYQVLAFSDANYDALTYTAGGLPPGLWISSAGVIQGTPAASGSYGVTVYASDGRGGTASSYFVINIAAVPPPNYAPYRNTAYPIPGADFYGTNRYLVETQYLVLPPDTFLDANNDPLTYTVLQKPDWLAYYWDPAAGHVFYGVPYVSGFYTVQLRAQDPHGASTVMTFYVQSTFEYYDPQNPTDPLRTQMQANLVAHNMGNAMTPDGGSVGDTESSMVPLAASMAVQSASATPEKTDYWYSYDAENRIKVNNGVQSGNQILMKAGNPDSWELVYDEVGQEIYRIENNGYATNVYRTDYDLRGNKTLEYHGHNLGSASNGVEREYRYDAANRLVETRLTYGADAALPIGVDDGNNPIMMDVAGWLHAAEQYWYDADGRLTLQVSRGRPSLGYDWWLPTYLPDPDAEQQRTNLAVLGETSRVTYGAGSYDAAGRAVSYTYKGIAIGGDTHTYNTTFEGWETYLEKTVTGSGNNPNYKTTTNTLTYDGYGRLRSQREHTNGVTMDDRIRYYTNTADGQVQLRRAGTMSGSTFVQTPDALGRRDNALFVYAAGQQQAELGEGGKIRTPFNVQLKGLNATGRYDAGGGKVVATEGDSLRSLAKRVYGSASYWFVLAEANGLSDPDALLIAGTSLASPSVQVNQNDAGTFKPYNPNDAIGSTAPSLPYLPPPPKNSCAGVAKVLALVVTVVVAIYAPMMAGAVQAAMLGAAGSIASQGILIAGGVQDGFSFKAVAMAAVGAGVSAGLPAASGFVGNVGRAMLSNAVTQGVAVAIGAQDSFDWKGVAISAVSSAIGYGAGSAVDALGGNDDLAGFARGFTVAASSASMRGTVNSESWAYIVADAIGATVGNRMRDNRDERLRLGAQLDREAWKDSNPFGAVVAVEGGEVSFRERYPYALASNSLIGGDVRRGNEIAPTPGWEGFAPRSGDEFVEIPYDPSIRTDETVSVYADDVKRTWREFADWQWKQDVRANEQAMRKPVAQPDPVVQKFISDLAMWNASNPYGSSVRDQVQHRLEMPSNGDRRPELSVQASEKRLRDATVQTMRESGLGDVRAGRVLIGVTDAYLHYPEMARDTILTLKYLNERSSIGSQMQDAEVMFSHIQQHGLRGAISMRADEALDRWGGAVDGLREAFREVTYGDGEAAGNLVFETAIGMLAPSRVFGRGSLVPNGIGAESSAAAFEGALYPAEKLRQLVPYLERRGVSVYGTEGNPRFIARADGTGMMELPANPTILQVKHELSHYLDFKKMGFEAYRDMGRTAREASVLERLQGNRLWPNLNQAEQDFSINYVERLRHDERVRNGY